MGKQQSYLKEWAVEFIRNKDLMAKKILSIDREVGIFDFVVKYGDKEQGFLVRPILGNLNSDLASLQEDGCYGLVAYNTKGNFEELLKSWEVLVKFKKLCIIFANPLSKTDKKWVIYPHTHDRVCDSDSWKAGLKTLFESVECMEQKQIEELIAESSSAGQEVQQTTAP